MPTNVLVRTVHRICAGVTAIDTRTASGYSWRTVGAIYSTTAQNNRARHFEDVGKDKWCVNERRGMSPGNLNCEKAEPHFVLASLTNLLENLGRL